MLRTRDQLEGPVYVVGDDVSASDLLAPEHLLLDADAVEDRRKMGASVFAPMAGRYGEFVRPGKFLGKYAIVIAGRRFGHGGMGTVAAATAMGIAGVRVVIAESFAEGFRRAAVNGGFVLPVVAAKRGAPLHERIRTGEKVKVDLGRGVLTLAASGEAVEMESPGILKEIVDAGGLLRYAVSRLGGSEGAVVTAAAKRFEESRGDAER